MSTARKSPLLGKKNRRRTYKRLRKMVDDFLDHLRYVVRQDWTQSREKELTLAKERYHRLADDVWKLMVQDEHPTNCSCAVCVGLRVQVELLVQEER